MNIRGTLFCACLAAAVSTARAQTASVAIGADGPAAPATAPEGGLPAPPSTAALASEAHALRMSGRLAEAAAAYAQAARSAKDSLRTVLRLEAARAWHLAGDDRRALTLIPQNRESRPWLRREKLALQAEVLLAAGRAAEADDAARQALEMPGEAADALWLLRLRAALATEKKTEALRALAALRVENPDTAPTRAAEALAAGAGMPLAVRALGAADLARRWSRWVARGGAEEAAGECRDAVAGLAQGPEDAARARCECGRAVAALRKPEAEPMLLAGTALASLRAPALLAVARLRSRTRPADDVAEICARLDESDPKSDEAAECAFLAGFMRLERGERAAATAALEEVARRFPSHARGADALWFLAMDAFGRDDGAAAALFSKAAESARSAPDRARVLYWRGRALAARDGASAAEDWRKAVSADPVGYYGWLAAGRLDASEALDRKDSATDAKPEAPADGCAAATVETAPAPADARFAEALLDAGFARLASLELDAVVAARRRRNRLDLTPFLARTGQFERLARIGHRAGGDAVLSAPGEAARAAMPRAFPEALACAPAGIDRCLLLALMRRESFYDPDATSGARARGLLQLLPSTAARLAAELGLEALQPEALHEPALNVRLGGRYVERLLARFDDPLPAAAAYNAGPAAVAKWLAARPGVGLDEWVERIPYRETRLYVKAVAEARVAYWLLYNGRRPPVRFELPRVSGGIDY